MVSWTTPARALRQFYRSARIFRLILMVAGTCWFVLPTAAQDAWLMKGHDARRTGQSGTNGPRSVDVGRSWTIEVPAAHTINIGASVSADAAFFGSWGLLRREPGNPDPRVWDKSDGTVYAVGLDTGEPFWDGPAELDLVPRCYEYEGRGPNLFWCGLTPYEVSFYNGTVEGQAAIDRSRGVIYVGRGDGKLFALDYESGHVLWRFTTFNPELPDDPDGGGEVVTSPLIADDGTIYFGTWGEGSYETNAVYAVNPDGSMRWRYPAPTSLTHRLFASPAMSPDAATIYFATFRDDDDSPGRLYAFDTSAGAMADEDRLRWEYELIYEGKTIDATTLAVGSDGTVYVGGFIVEGFGVPVVLAVTDRGDDAQPKWTPVRFSDGAQLVLGIALREVGGETRRMYVTTSNLGGALFNAKVEGSLYAVNPLSGDVLAEYDPSDDVSEAEGGINSPAIGADGAVYFGVRGRYGENARQGHYFGVEYDEDRQRFERLWSVKTDGYVEWSNPAIGPDGGIYAGSSSLDEKARTVTHPEGDVPEGTTAWFHAIKGPANSVANEAPEGIGSSRLHPPYPNPFADRTTVPLELDAEQSVQIQVFDMLGRLVRTIQADVRATGPHPVEWNGLDDAGRPVAAGVYVLRVRTAGRLHQAVLVKSR